MRARSSIAYGGRVGFGRSFDASLVFQVNEVRNRFRERKAELVDREPIPENIEAQLERRARLAQTRLHERKPLMVVPDQLGCARAEIRPWLPVPG